MRAGCAVDRARCLRSTMQPHWTAGGNRRHNGTRAATTTGRSRGIAALRSKPVTAFHAPEGLLEYARTTTPALPSAPWRSRPRQPAAARGGGDVLFDACFARPLFDRRLDLPDRPDRRASCRRAMPMSPPRSKYRRELGVPVLPRGAGTSQCGQTVGAALVIDNSKHLNRIVALDREARTVTVEPGVVLDQLNAHLRPHRPVVSGRRVARPRRRPSAAWPATTPAARARSRYGNMVHNVHAVDARLADGTEVRFGPDAGMRDARRPSARASRRSARDRRARSATRSRARFPRCCGAWAATTSTCSIRKASVRTRRTAASTGRTCWSDPKARSRVPARSRCASRRCRAQRTLGVVQLPDASTARWSARSTSWGSVPPRWNWSTAR